MLNGEIDLSMSTDDYLLYISELISNGYMSAKRLLIEIEKLVKTDIEKAVRLLDMVCSMDEVKDKSIELNYLRNLISEKVALNRLDSDQRETFNKLMIRGREL